MREPLTVCAMKTYANFQNYSRCCAHLMPARHRRERCALRSRRPLARTSGTSNEETARPRASAGCRGGIRYLAHPVQACGAFQFHIALVRLDGDVLFSWSGCLCAPAISSTASALVAEGASLGGKRQALPNARCSSLWKPSPTDSTPLVESTSTFASMRWRSCYRECPTRSGGSRPLSGCGVDCPLHGVRMGSELLERHILVHGCTGGRKCVSDISSALGASPPGTCCRKAYPTSRSRAACNRTRRGRDMRFLGQPAR